MVCLEATLWRLDETKHGHTESDINLHLSSLGLELPTACMNDGNDQRESQQKSHASVHNDRLTGTQMMNTGRQAGKQTHRRETQAGTQKRNTSRQKRNTGRHRTVTQAGRQTHSG